jgi:methionyl-tRNA formyltransferase
MRIVLWHAGVRGGLAARLLRDGAEVKAVFTQPDKTSGRGMRRNRSREGGRRSTRLPVLQPAALKDGAALAQLRASRRTSWPSLPTVKSFRLIF